MKLRVLAVPALNSTAVHNWPVRWLRGLRNSCVKLLLHAVSALAKCWSRQACLAHGEPCDFAWGVLPGCRVCICQKPQAVMRRWRWAG